jgi:response regulator RpfG family c-di-GMP phosphodiesterase
MGYSQASSIILENRGTQFDPEVVDTFKSIQDQIKEVTDTFGYGEAQGS